jgi:amino acid adenylation domain-containing protein
MSDVLKKLAALPPEKLALLQQRISRRTEDHSRIRSVPRNPAANSFPLSFAQQRLWFLDRLQPNTSLYNIPTALHLKFPLNVAALEQSLNEIVRRHETLRTTFAMINSEPVQVIAPPQKSPLRVIDLRIFPALGREYEAQRLASEEAQRPFDLERGPLFRSTLLQLDEADYALLLTMHHIISDGWSINVLTRELGTLYAAYSEGQPSPLPDLPIQYADFAQWQRHWLQGERLKSLLDYWGKQLDGAPMMLELPTDRPRPPVQSFRGAVQGFTLSPVVLSRLKALSQQDGVTLFMTLLAAFNVLLHRYTGQADLVVGTPIASRNLTQLEGLIGFFVNTLILRLDLSGNPTFHELLSRVRDVTLGAYAHQDLPFEKLVEELQPERSLSHNPLFQVMFTLDSFSGTDKPPAQSKSPAEAPHTPPDTPASVTPVVNGTSKFDLSLWMSETEKGLTGGLEYSTDLFDASLITNMIGHLQVLLEGIAANPSQRLSDLPLLTEAERQRLLVEWNATEAEYPAEECLHELFESQVERTPDAVAAVFGDESLSYRELNARANQLSHHLQRIGVGPDVLVGIAVERSLEMLVGLLGIMKAGGAFVPLDPSYPKERLSFMLEDSQVSVLLTQSRLSDRLPACAAKVVYIDAGREELERESRENPDAKVTPQNLAYVIYTSGSTGRPKGVMVAHRGLSNMAEAQLKTFGIGSQDRVLQFSSLSFDISIWDIVLALNSGATLCLESAESLRPGSGLTRLLRERGVTAMTLLPSVLATLSPEELPSVRTVIAGAEVCPADVAARWASGRRFVNGYGPTEATIWATYADCQDGNRKPPIGRPIANTQTYVLNSFLQPVPVGLPGELYIGGVGLARGYLHRPELTAERFIPHPFSRTPGERLYRTGDLVRRLPDGNIDFLGRVDLQVKVRGYRVELGEIESVIAEHPSVREVVVVAIHESFGGEKRLVAYLVPAHPDVSLTGELRDYLRDRLPEYMVPQAFVVLEALPLMPNGKVARQSLPAPELIRPELAEKYVAPRDAVEERLAEIWEEVLGLEQIGVNDNFFELGGHSLLATQVISRMRDAFNTDLPLQSIFESPTIAGLASIINGDGAGQEAQAARGGLEQETKEQLLARLDQLSDAEVSALLGEMLG